MKLPIIQELADTAHKNAVDKGFWVPNRNMNEARMLVITELAESVEAHRKDRWADIKSFNTLTREWSKGKTNHTKEEFRTLKFEQYIKDTVEAELADAYIRLLDILWFETEGDVAKAFKKGEFDTGDIFTNNYAETLKNICKYIDSTGFMMFAIEIQCLRLDINLGWFIREINKQNAKREYKHDKKY